MNAHLPKLIRSIFLLVTLIVFVNKAQAQSIGNLSVRSKLDGAAGQLVKDSMIVSQDSIYFNSALLAKLDTPYHVKNLINFSINEYSNVYLADSFTATIQLRIYYMRPDRVMDSVDQTLKITYDTARTYTQRNSFVFNDAHQVKVKVLSITAPARVIPALQVENEMRLYPIYKLSCTDDAVKAVYNNNPANTDSTDELLVNWPVVVGVNDFDLEWTYIDSTALLSGRYGSPSSPNADLLFKYNSSRVTVASNSYAIPLMYDDGGVLFYRVRGVQESASNYNRMETAWSSNYSGGLGSYNFCGHQRALNWQSNISYAEEGKRKVVVQYFDGSLRNRQTVTKDNTTNTTIVAESMYDYQGRPVIQVLPAPTLNTVIKYSANFNRGLNSPEYDKELYDHIDNPADLLIAHAAVMDSVSGANQYYSLNNPDKDKGFNRFIPQANGYAFAETEYTSDNTGRISRQGGVGQTFQLGSGHETKYYYGATPSENDLYALFGTEVGDKSHYFKNMVVDANGQASISYVDMHGRTIATALAGTAANPSISDIPDKDTLVVTDSLITPGTNQVQQNALVAVQDKMVPQDSAIYAFNYTLTPPVLSTKDCNGNTVCYTSLYDLEIKITDDANNQHLGGHPFDTILHNYVMGGIIPNCNAPAPVTASFNIKLYQGVYTITKILTVSQQAMAFYRDSIYGKLNHCVSMADMVQQQRSLQLQTQCIPDCQTCRDSLGTFPQFLVSYTRRAGGATTDTGSYHNDALVAYQAAMSACDDLCNVTTESQQLRSAMLQDMSAPSGQYATLADSADIYSIYYYPDPSVKAIFRRDDITYLNDYGQPDMVFNEATNTYVRPQDLPEDVFAAKFKSSWAEALLRFHPEACKLNAFLTYSDSQHWDKDFEATDSYTDALQKGYLNPTGLTSFAYTSVPGHIDSLVTGHPALVSQLNSTIQNYKQGLSIWSLATIETKCNGDDKACHDLYNTPLKAFTNSGMCGGDLDMAWRNFRTMYLLIKHDLINTAVSQVSNCNGLLNVSSDELLQIPFPYQKQPRFMTTTSALNQTGLSSYITTDQTTTDAAKAKGSALAAAAYDDNCRQYALAWVQQLAPCKYDATALNQYIIPELIKICKAGSDADHPNGASSVPPGSSAVYKSFEDVLKAYNSSRGITDPLICNSQLITSPQPYTKQTPTVPAVAYTRPTTCQCEKLQLLQQEYDSVKTSADVNLAAYLARTRGATISQSDLDVLLDACSAGNGTNSCTYLSKAVTIPVFMQCDGAASCATCTDVNNTYAAFKLAYPNILPAKGDVDSVQYLKNNLFASYMNSHLGFGKQTWEYLDFMDSCANGVNRGPGHMVCKTISNKYITWTISDTKTSQFTDLKRTASGYIMAGWTTGFGNGGKDGYLAKVDLGGNVLWAKSFGGVADDNFNRIIATADNGFIAIGTTASNCESVTTAMIVKIDSSGNELWSRVLDLNTDASEGWDIIQTSDSNYAFAAVRKNVQTNIKTDWITGVFNPDGNLQWMRMIGTPEAKSSTYLLQDNDTLVLAAGMTPSGGTQVTSLLKENRNTGAFISLDKYTVEGAGSTANDIVKTADGYRLSVAAGQHGDLVDINKGGAVTAAKKYDSNGGVMTKWSSAPLPDGGTIASYTVGNNVYWMALNVDQSVNWTNEERINGSTLVNKVITNPDGSFAGAGQSLTNAMLMKPTIIGRTGCSDTNVVVTATDVSAAVSRQSVGTYTDVLLSSLNINAIDVADSNYTPPLAYTSCNGLDSCYLVGDGPMLCGAATPAFPAMPLVDISSCSDSAFFALSAGTVRYKTYTDSLNNVFEHDYMQKALNVGTAEKFAVSFEEMEYHYTLFYYDQAGNLVKTVPPAGAVVDRSDTWINQVKAAKAAGVNLPVGHGMVSQYRFNTLNATVVQNTPDAGQNHFWYDRLGRIAVSQNAKQILTNDYSYTDYDYLGRITEVGQLHSPAGISDLISRNDVSLGAWINNAAATKEQIVQTNYDLAHTPLEGYVWNAENLRNRVSWSAVYNTAAQLQSGYNRASATYYSYDIHGNVKELLQEFNSGIVGDTTTLGHYKKIAYNYDLISGKVNTVSYSPGQPDAFYHRYNYDAENRITDVETSRDSLFWEHDAFYQYYKNGPLARTVLGQQQVQGLDYAYTLQGWIKGVNGTAPGTASEMGGDGGAGSFTAKDALGYSLNYYGAGDYKSLTNTAAFASVDGGLFKPLYNGNIGAMSVNLPKVGESLLYHYSYDALNRIVGMQTAKGFNATTNSWTQQPVPDFGERISYDANGNIGTYTRHGNNTWAGKPLGMDSMVYHYPIGTNKLDYIHDNVAATAYDEDIDDQAEHNYQYDAIGNLTGDVASGIQNIHWTVYGKIADIVKTGNSNISYTYDVTGNRISKTVNGKMTWYVRDAQGNVMSTYMRGDTSTNAGRLSQIEEDLYGSGRLGMSKHVLDLERSSTGTTTNLTGIGAGSLSAFDRKEKMFELSNHLGNVLAATSDVKLPVTANGNTVDYYSADVQSAQDYYPFGMQEPGRTFSNAVYRYGFNGQEVSHEIASGTTTATYWEYDGRIGRRWNLDQSPTTGISAYSTFFNNPNFFKDPLGDTSKFFGNSGSLMFQNNKGKGTDLYVVNKIQFDLLNSQYKNKEKLTGELMKIGVKAYADQDVAAISWAPGGFAATKGDGLERGARIFRAKAFGDKEISYLYVVGSTVTGRKSKEIGVSQETDVSGSSVILGGMDITAFRNTGTATERRGSRILTRETITYQAWGVSAMVHTHPGGNDNFSISVGDIFDGETYGGDYGIAAEGVNVYLVPTTNHAAYQMFRLDLSPEDKHMYFHNSYEGQQYMRQQQRSIYFKDEKVVQ